MRRPAIGANEIENENGEPGKDQKGLKNHFPLLFNKGGNSENEPSSNAGTSKRGVLKIGGRK